MSSYRPEKFTSNKAKPKITVPKMAPFRDAKMDVGEQGPTEH